MPHPPPAVPVPVALPYLTRVGPATPHPLPSGLVLMMPPPRLVGPALTTQQPRLPRPEPTILQAAIYHRSPTAQPQSVICHRSPTAQP